MRLLELVVARGGNVVVVVGVGSKGGIGDIVGGWTLLGREFCCTVVLVGLAGLHL